MSVSDVFLSSSVREAAASPSPGRSRLREGALAAVLLAPTFLFLVAFVYAPAVMAALAFFNFHPGGSIAYAGVSNFRAAIADPIFWRSMEKLRLRTR